MQFLWNLVKIRNHCDSLSLCTLCLLWLNWSIPKQIWGGGCFENPTTAPSAQICFVLQHYSAVNTLQSPCLGQALKGRLDHHARRTSTEVQNLAPFLLCCVSVSTEVGIRGCIRVVLSVLTPCAECGASCSVLTSCLKPPQTTLGQTCIYDHYKR